MKPKAAERRKITAEAALHRGLHRGTTEGKGEQRCRNFNAEEGRLAKVRGGAKRIPIRVIRSCAGNIFENLWLIRENLCETKSREAAKWVTTEATLHGGLHRGATEGKGEQWRRSFNAEEGRCAKVRGGAERIPNPCDPEQYKTRRRQQRS